MKPLVSIVIPVYNRERYISQAIESAINQTYDHIEIIIGDNQSEDKTWDIITAYASKDPRIHAFQNETNVGPVLNWRNCFQKATGEFLKIIWSDDFISNDFIEKALSVFDDETAFVLSGIITIDEPLNEISFVSKYRKEMYTTKEYLDDIFLWRKEGFPVSPGAAFFRLQDVLQNFIIDIPNRDNLDSKTNGAGNDQLLYLNIAHSYHYVKIIPDTISYFRKHQQSFSYNDITIYYEWGKHFFLTQHKNRLYSDLFKYWLWRYYLKKKNFKQIYKSVHYSVLCIISFFVLLRFYMKKYMKI